MRTVMLVRDAKRQYRVQATYRNIAVVERAVWVKVVASDGVIVCRRSSDRGGINRSTIQGIQWQSRLGVGVCAYAC